MPVNIFPLVVFDFGVSRISIILGLAKVDSAPVCAKFNTRCSDSYGTKKKLRKIAISIVYSSILAKLLHSS